jgi:NTE family protein
MLFHAVEIDGEHYWDGGYSVNPAVTPLIESCTSADVMLVQINPLQRDGTPQTAREIADRVSELTFNASLLTQMRSIDLVNRLIAQGALRGSDCRTVHMHRIDGGTVLQAWPASSRVSTDPGMIRAMFEAGQQAARHWLGHHFDAIGVHGTVDIRRDYLDDTREPLPRPPAPTGAPARGFRPWLARMFRRSKHA